MYLREYNSYSVYDSTVNFTVEYGICEMMGDGEFYCIQWQIQSSLD